MSRTVIDARDELMNAERPHDGDLMELLERLLTEGEHRQYVAELRWETKTFLTLREFCERLDGLHGRNLSNEPAELLLSTLMEIANGGRRTRSWSNQRHVETARRLLQMLAEADTAMEA